MSQTKLPDQSDIIAQLEQAQADLGTARQTISTLQTQVTSLTSERDALKQSNQTLTEERDSARTERDRLKADSQEDFDRRLAAALVKHGIRNTGGETKEQNQPAKKLTADERIAQAKASQATK